MNRQRANPSADPERVEAFDDLYDTTFTQVLAHCRRRTRSLHDAEDAVAETYLVAWRRLDDATAAESPLLWLYAVAVKVTANQRRGQDRFRRLIDRLDHLFTPTVVEASDAPILTAADAAQVAAALEILGPTDREIMRLVAYEELSYAEAGVVVGLSEAAVRTRLYRARRRLRRHLDELRRDDPGLPDTSLDEAPTRRPGEGREEQP